MAATRSRRCSVAYQSSSSHLVTRSPEARSPNNARTWPRSRSVAIRTAGRAARARRGVRVSRLVTKPRGARTGSRRSDSVARPFARSRTPPSAVGSWPSGPTRWARPTPFRLRGGERGKVLIAEWSRCTSRRSAMECRSRSRGSARSSTAQPQWRQRDPGRVIRRPRQALPWQQAVHQRREVDEQTRRGRGVERCRRQSTARCSRAAATSRRRLRSLVGVDGIRSRGVVTAHPRGEKPVGACTCGRCAASHRRASPVWR